MNLSPLEEQLTKICKDTNTTQRCGEAIDEIRLLESKAKTVSDADDLAEAKNHMFAKGNLFALEQNQEYQIMEGQKAFVGNWNENIKRSNGSYSCGRKRGEHPILPSWNRRMDRPR
jgi:hypothetical protein